MNEQSCQAKRKKRQKYRKKGFAYSKCSDVAYYICEICGIALCGKCYFKTHRSACRARQFSSKCIKKRVL